MYGKIEEDPEYFEEVYPQVWLMDDHKWSYYIWESHYQQNQNIPSTLVHIDYHWDAINDIVNEEAMSLICNSDLSQLKDEIKKDVYLRKDSFIAPAIIKEYIKNVYFFCKQTDTEIGLDKTLLQRYKVDEYRMDNIQKISSCLKDKRILLDIDVDIFNKTTDWATGELWEEKEIYSFLSECDGLIKNADVITVAMSHGYSGSPADTKYLTEVTVAKVLKIKEQFA